MTGPVITPEELSNLLASGSPPTVLDVRWRMGEASGWPAYLAGHLPGAAYLDLETALADPPGERGRHPLPAPARLEVALREAGVRRERPVVVMDDWSGRAAARAWWVLRWAGHRDVRVLDGGWTAWLATGGAVETGEAPVAPGDLTVRPGSMPVVDVGDLTAVPVIVDAREPARYRGEHEPVDPVAGHVPGAVNVPTSANLDTAGRFRPAAELRELYGGVGALDGEVAVYCGSGVTACHDVLALDLIGVRAALYPGSWSHWVTDRSRPVETGPGR